MPRNDGRGPTQNKFGKPGTSFPFDGLDYVMVVEGRTAPQANDRKAIFSVHPRSGAGLLYPAGTILTSQGTEPGDNTDANWREVYETLPGPWIPFTRYDTFLGPVQGRRRIVQNTGQIASLTATVKTTYEARGQSDAVSWETEETSGSGLGGGFSGYPIGTEDLYDREKGAYERKTQVVVVTNTEVASFTAPAGVATMIEYVPLDGYEGYLLKKIVETFDYPTPLLKDDEFDNERSGVNRTTQLVADTTTAGTISVSAGVATDTRYEPYNSVLRRVIVTTWSVPGPARTFNILKRRGFAATQVTTRVNPASTPTSETELIDVERTPEGKDRVREDVFTYVSGGSPLVTRRFNDWGGLDVTTDKFVAPSTTPTNVTFTVQELRQEREKQARLIETVIATGSSITEIENADARVPGSRAVDVSYLVLASSSIPADTTTKVYRRIKFPPNPLMRIETERTYSIPADYTEYRDLGFGFPTLFTSYFSNTDQGVTIKNRGGFSVVVPHQIDHTFVTGGSAVPPVPFQIIPNELTLFSFQIQGLMDAGTATHYSSRTGITYSQSYDASTPSRTTYAGLIGTQVIAGGSCEVYRAGIYDKTTIKVTLQ